MPGRPTRAIALNFGMRADIADVITRARLCVNRFRGFGIVTPQFCHSSVAISWLPLLQYSVSTTVLYCDITQHGF